MQEFVMVTKIELYKISKRKDAWLMYALLLVPILYSVGLSSGSTVITYTGTGNLTALSFTAAMFQITQSMFVFNVILAAMVGRSLATEIENKSILLYLNRIGKRRLVYIAKGAALFIYSLFIDVLLILTSMLFYYAVLSNKTNIANGKLYDANMLSEIVQVTCICIFWLITICFVLAISTRFKMFVGVAIYMILYIAMNLISYVSGLKYISPQYYITDFTGSNTAMLCHAGAFILYFVCVGLILTYMGTRRLEKIDL